MFWPITQELESIHRFLGLGGDVLIAIFFVTVALWTLVLERYLFFARQFPLQSRTLIESWRGRSDTTSWYARQIRRQMISEVAISTHRSVAMIKTLIALCPLLGLLGTVVGMVQVFDVLAVTGTGSPRAMAAGISKATIPTMAGMVAALSGLYFSLQLQKKADMATRNVTDQLQHN